MTFQDSVFESIELEHSAPNVHKSEYYTISDLAEALKVPASKVKHWVNVGLIEPAITCKGGVRIFNTMGLLRAMTVRRYREERYTIAEIKVMLQNE